jgi:uncharacterized protein YjbJ (UPF0337 family)
MKQSTEDKASGKVRELKGKIKVKKGWATLTNNRDLVPIFQRRTIGMTA